MVKTTKQLLFFLSSCLPRTSHFNVVDVKAATRYVGRDYNNIEIKGRPGTAFKSAKTFLASAVGPFTVAPQCCK